MARYDRQVDKSGRIARLHQEDFCQALGVPPELKYQNEGGPDLASCFSLLRQATSPSAPQLLRLFDDAVFNALIGNNDAHAKNFSLLYQAKTPTLAPLYDTLSTSVYPKLSSKMAMKLGGKYKFSEVQARHWDRFAEGAGLARAQTRKGVLAMARAMPAAARQAQQAPDLSNNTTIKDIISVIEQRSALTITRLTEAEKDRGRDTR